MSDYIERDLLLAEIKELKKSPWYNGGYGTYERNIRREAIDIIVDLCIRPAPAVDVQEIKYGKWIETQEPLGWCDVDCAECSVCHESWIIDEDSSIDDYERMWRYCPNCGAKMDGGNNNA
nr:MAG TPA: zinc-ribbon domain protein [Myoviridae sp. ct5FH28]